MFRFGYYETQQIQKQKIAIPDQQALQLTEHVRL